MRPEPTWEELEARYEFIWPCHYCGSANSIPGMITSAQCAIIKIATDFPGMPEIDEITCSRMRNVNT